MSRPKIRNATGRLWSGERLGCAHASQPTSPTSAEPKPPQASASQAWLDRNSASPGRIWSKVSTAVQTLGMSWICDQSGSAPSRRRVVAHAASPGRITPNPETDELNETSHHPGRPAATHPRARCRPSRALTGRRLRICSQRTDSHHRPTRCCPPRAVRLPERQRPMMSTTQPIYHNRVGSHPLDDLPPRPLPPLARADLRCRCHATSV